MSKATGLVVIGGGSGFVGSAIHKTLQSRGYESVIISRQERSNSITWNNLRKNGLPNGTTAVINVAGQNVLDPSRRWTDGFKQNVFASRVKTTEYLAEAIGKAEKKPKAFVTISGVGFYEPSTSVIYDESSPGGNFDFLSRLCTDWEKASNLPPQMNVRTVNIRSGVVLGRDGGMIKQLWWPFFFGLGGPIGDGMQAMPWIHIEDLSNLFVRCIEDDSAKGVYNGVAPQIMSNKEFTKAFGSALYRPTFIPLPVFAVNGIFNPERAKIMIEGQKVVPKRVQEMNFEYKYRKVEDACKAIVSSQ